MTEMIICGRGGQGGVTLAKLIAAAYFLRDKHVQAFGVYAAERSGAPLQAFVRVDDREITNHNQIRSPDHVVVLDRTLIGPGVSAGHNADGWIVLNTPAGPESFSDVFPGRRVATIDATSIAVEQGLGTRTVPIVNTTMLGAVGRVIGLTQEDVRAALAEVGFTGANESAAARAFECVRMRHLAGVATEVAPRKKSGRVTGILDDAVGAMPAIHTGDWATRRPERRSLKPPCNNGCPAGNDVQAFVGAVSREDYAEALRVILQTSPFPGVCGRVCPAPCTQACNRTAFDEAINVAEIERFVSDRWRRPEPSAPWRAERVAVVGSGPAGLSAAYHLARLGYAVTVYESGEELGGVMRTGIPAYRLPREVLDREIEYILENGVTAKMRSPVSRKDLLRLTHEYAAVFVGTGLQSAQGLELGGARGAVEQGLDFLDRVRREPEDMTGQRLVVIGGGNTAIDAARTARRSGAHVTILYRRSRAEMPAIAGEVEAAIEEGVTLNELVSPLQLRRGPTGALLTCVRMRLGEADESGRRRPIPEETEDAYFDVAADRVILALGQSANLSILPEGGEVHDGRALMGLTGAPVFCGGDFATDDGTVAAAIGSGHRAALHIHRTLTGEDMFPPAGPEVATAEAITMHVFSHAPRRRGEVLPAAQRRRSFAEVHVGFNNGDGVSAAVAEARRCFSCGVCNQCDRCLEHCPEGILMRDGAGYRFDYDYCKGCGICATQCPRGVIYMAEL
ncbi:MAG: FAD-dependent oxidoreductase [Phycisphaerales bacterium]|nr:FAD-dependent oxidoreductase [Phycisphaerales bacterium]